MVFVDFMNYYIAMKDLYRNDESSHTPKIDHVSLFKNIPSLIGNVDYIKTFIFAPMPDDFLIKDPKLLKQYKWLQGINSKKYVDVIWGRHIARQKNAELPMNIDDSNTYYMVEKGTDINLAAQLLIKAFYNAYDVAFVLSGDTDYISVYRQIRALGKLVVPVCVKKQNISKLIPEVDDHRSIGKEFISRYIQEDRPERPSETNKIK